MPSVFISHATADREFVVREIIGTLKQRKIQTWFAPADIATSQDWEKQIRKGLQKTKWFLVVVSPRSARSEWVKAEVKWAVENRWEPERIVIVVLEDCDLSSFHLWLPRLQYIDYQAGRLGARKKLLALCERIRRSCRKAKRRGRQGAAPQDGEPGPEDPAYAPVGAGESGDVAVATDTASVEITINRDFDSYSREQQDKLLQAIKSIIEADGDVRVTRRRRGSVKLTLAMTGAQAERLRWAIESGELEDHDVVGFRFADEPGAGKPSRSKRRPAGRKADDDPPAAFSSDLLTPEGERKLLTEFWDCRRELVQVLLQQIPVELRPTAPTAPTEPWPMAQFIREFCTEDRRADTAVRRVHDKYVHFKHRLASANIRLAAHVARRFRHHALSYSDLLQEAVWGLMQAIDRFDVSHGTRLATYATWWIRQTLQNALARDSHLVKLSPDQLRELGLLPQESEVLPGDTKDASAQGESPPSPGEHTESPSSPDTPVSLNAVLDDDSDFKLTEAMPDNTSSVAQTNNERQEALGFLMENLRPRERKVLDLRFGLTGSGTHSLRQIGHLLRISKERVRQIQNQALEKVRASAESAGWDPSLLLE